MLTDTPWMLMKGVQWSVDAGGVGVFPSDVRRLQMCDDD